MGDRTSVQRSIDDWSNLVEEYGFSAAQVPIILADWGMVEDQLRARLSVVEQALDKFMLQPNSQKGAAYAMWAWEILKGKEAPDEARRRVRGEEDS